MLCLLEDDSAPHATPPLVATSTTPVEPTQPDIAGSVTEPAPPIEAEPTRLFDGSRPDEQVERLVETGGELPVWPLAGGMALLAAGAGLLWVRSRAAAVETIT